MPYSMGPVSSIARDSFVGQMMQVAGGEAALCNHAYLGVEHVLMALTRCEGGYTERMLQRLDRKPEELCDTLRKRAGIDSPNNFDGRMVATPRLRQTLARLMGEAGGSDVGERLLLLAILQSGPGLAVRTLIADGARIETIIADVRADSGPEASAPTPQRISHQREQAPDVADHAAAPHAERATGTPNLDRFGRDLTALARARKLTRVVPRKSYFAEIARALVRQDHNTPVLVGEAGVGKTAIVEGLAQRLAQEDERPVTPALQGKRIIELRPSDLVAGAGVRGEFEERLRDILRECATHPEVLLFIDEIHTLVGAGHHAGNQDAAQLIKPALERGELRLIGATTDAEYQRYIAEDAALARRFQKIPVAEPDLSETEALLREAQSAIEARTGMKIEPAALVAAIELSVRYIFDQRLPGKAINVLYEACSYVIIPPGGSISVYDLDAPEYVVTPAQVEQAVSARVGFPISQTEGRLRERLQEMADQLRQHVIAQEQATMAVAESLRVAFSSLRDPNRPRAVFLFAGPSGVGKTETARVLAQTLFGAAASQQMLTLDMAEFSQEHMLAQLIGSPPGYVNSDQEGRLTGWLRLHPLGIVLLDEIEKADRQVRQALLGLFENGRITDGRGRTVNGREAIYIMTSNLLANSASAAGDGAYAGNGGGATLDRPPVAQLHSGLGTSMVEELTRQRLVAALSPEFVGRIDRIILYQPLGRDALLEIAKLKIDEIRDLLLPQRVSLDLSDEVYGWLIQRGVSPDTGARDLARTITSAIRAPIADLQFRGKLTPGATIHVTLENGHPHVTA